MKRPSPACAKWLAPATGLLICLAGTSLTGCIGCRVADSVAGQAQSANGPSAPRQILIIIDLSPSLTIEERLRIPHLIADVIKTAPAGSSVKVLVLETNMGNRAPLLDVTVPNAPTTSQQIDQVLWLQSIAQQLQDSVKEILTGPIQRQHSVLTSCYIASAIFANEFFSNRPGEANRSLIWFGDLIEDCPEKPFVDYRLPKRDAVKNLRSLQLHLASLQSVEIRAVMIPRSFQDPESEVPAETIRGYWRELTPHLGLATGAIQVGTSDELGIREVALQ